MGLEVSKKFKEVYVGRESYRSFSKRWDRLDLFWCRRSDPETHQIMNLFLTNNRRRLQPKALSLSYDYEVVTSALVMSNEFTITPPPFAL